MTDFNFKHKFKSIKIAAFLNQQGLEIEIEPNNEKPAGEVWFMTEPVDQATKLIMDYQSGATVPAQAILACYADLLKRVRDVQQRSGK